MIYQLLISDEAALDIVDAYYWYESQRKELGNEFEKNLDDGLKRITNNPHHFQDKYNTVRIHYMERFPYGVHYLLENEKIKIVGVFHTARNPKSWIERLK